MLVIESDTYIGHYPNWRFTLGSETYKTKDIPSRVEAIKKVLLKDNNFQFLKAGEFPEERISRIHPYHDFIKQVSLSIEDPKTEIYPDLFPGEGAKLPKKMNPLWAGLYCTDAVTPILKYTYKAAKGSADIAMTGAEMILEGKEKVIYALCRPSGHHAGPRVFGGYCYFNNVVSAAEILAQKGTTAILDIDYHHGNGTQEFFQKRKDVFTCSLHGDPEVEYPYFWGYADERGKEEGLGTNFNIPLPLNSGDMEYLHALDKAVTAIKEFNPQFLIIAAGFDTHKDDPIGGFSLTTKIYSQMAKKIALLDIPTLICQEGGYRIKILGACVHEFLSGF